MTDKGNEAPHAAELGDDEIAAVSGGDGTIGSGMGKDGGYVGSGGGRDGGGTIGSGT